MSGLSLTPTPPPPSAEALKAMEKVASHINEMQKIYEDYGSVFDQLVSEQIGHDREVRTAPRVGAVAETQPRFSSALTRGTCLARVVCASFPASGLRELNTFTS